MLDTPPQTRHFSTTALATLVVCFSIVTSAAAQDELGEPDDNLSYETDGDSSYETDDEPIYQTEVRVPRPPPTAVDETPGFAVVIDTQETVGQLTSVSKLIEQSPGVSTRSLGGLGGFASVSVRGSAANQVLVLVDGVPLSTARTNVASINAIPPDLLARVEVYRSGAPIWLGSAPMGAVINLVTRDDLDRSLIGSGSWGSFSSRKLSLIGSTPLMADPDWEALLGLTYLGSSGNFVYYDDRGTPFNSTDDSDVLRQNNDFNAGNLLFRTNFSPNPNLDLSLMESAWLDDRGVPGLGQNQSDVARYKSFRSTTQLSADALAWPGNIADTRVRVWFDAFRDRFTDRNGEIGLGRRDLVSNGWTFGSQLRLSLFPWSALDLDLVTDVGVETYASHDEMADNAPRSDAQRTTVAPALSANINLFDRHLILSGGSRVEFANSRFGTAVPYTESPASPEPERSDPLWTAQGGLRLMGGSDDLSVSLHGTAGRFARLPTMLEMFGDTGAVVGNGALVPETSIGGDVGVTLQWLDDVVSSTTTVAVFGYWYENLIQLVQNSQRIARPENISRARILGVETGLTGSILDVVTVNLAYTYTDAVDTSDVAGQADRQLPGRPRHAFRGSVGAVWSGVQVGYDIDAESGNVLDRAGYRRVPERIFHGLILGYHPTFFPNWCLTLEIDNLLDNRVEEVPVLPQPPGIEVTTQQAISDYYGFPLPGRTVFLTLAWNTTPED